MRDESGLVGSPWGAFVGRERELGVLAGALDEAGAGRGRLVLLAGEPGVGKARTADAFAGMARARGTAVLWGRCHEGEGAPAYWPWIQVLRAHLGDPAALADMGTAAADLAALVPEVRELAPDLPESPPLEAAAARFRLFDAVVGALRRAARRRPLAIVLDDVHRADAPSLLLLQAVARRLADAAAVVLATYRDSDVRREDPLRATLGEVVSHPHVERLELRGLSEAEVGRVVEQAIGRPAPAAVVARLWTRTGGNPLFVGEMVRWLVVEGGLDASGDAAPPDAALPAGVREVIARRLDRLSPDCRGVLGVASVVGREFPLHVVAEVCDLRRQRVLDVLEEAVGAQIVGERPAAPGRFAFVHALVCECLYDDLPAAERRRLHRRVGEVMEATYAPSQLEASLLEVAHHFLAAAPAGDAQKAIDWAVRAAARATAVLAHEEAAEQFRAALATLPLLDADAPQARCALLLGLGEALAKAGDPAGARQAFGEAAAIARGLGDATRLARAALGLAGQWTATIELDPAVVRTLEETLVALGPDDGELRARVLARLATALYWADSRARREALSRKAIEVAQRVGDTATLAWALEARRYALWGPENLEERLTLDTEILRLGKQSGDRAMALAGHFWRMVDLLELGEITGVERELEASARLATELREPLYLQLVAIARATLAYLRADFEVAERLALDAFAVGQRARRETAEAALPIQMAAIRREQGRLPEILPTSRELVERYPTLYAYRAALAFHYAELGRAEEARAEFERLAANDFADLPRDFTWCLALNLLADACTFLRDAPRAALLYDLLLPFAGRNVVVGPALIATGAASYHLAKLASTLRRWDESERHFEDAAALNTRLGAPTLLAGILRAHAEMLLARDRDGDRERARALLGRVIATADRYDMRALLPAARALLARCAPAPSVRVFVMRREGDHWTLAHGGAVTRLRATKGLAYLAHLLRHPGRDHPAADLLALAGGRPGTDGAPAGEHARWAATKRIRSALVRIRASQPAMAEHLTAHVRTGRVCGYHPDPDRPVVWEL